MTSIKETFMPTTASDLTSWIAEDMQATMRMETQRVSTWLSWIDSGTWTFDQIAGTICEVAVRGRQNGAVMDRDTFRNYCKSLSLLSKQMGENPVRSFDGRLDVASDLAKKRERKGYTLFADADRFESKGSKTSLYRIACIHVKDEKRAERPLDTLAMPDDVVGFVEETSEESKKQMEEYEAAKAAYLHEKDIESANVILRNLPDPMETTYGDSLKVPMSKVEAFRLHMARVDWRMTAKDVVIGELEQQLADLRAAKNPRQRAKKPA